MIFQGAQLVPAMSWGIALRTDGCAHSKTGIANIMNFKEGTGPCVERPEEWLVWMTLDHTMLRCRLFWQVRAWLYSHRRIRVGWNVEYIWRCHNYPISWQTRIYGQESVEASVGKRKEKKTKKNKCKNNDNNNKKKKDKKKKKMKVKEEEERRRKV